MRFETLTGAKITTHGTCSDRTDYFVLELEKVRKGHRRVGGGGSKGSNEPPLKFDNGGLKYK